MSLKATGLLVPADALRQDNGRDFVFVVNGERAERRAVAVAEHRRGEVLIASGISAGERVVIDAPLELTDGSRIQEQRK